MGARHFMNEAAHRELYIIIDIINNHVWLATIFKILGLI